MIIQFSAANFRSYRTEQTISFVAARAEKQNADSLVTIPIPGMSNTSLLKGLCVFGSNASGKSNILSAIAQLKFLVATSDSIPDTVLAQCYVPFILDEKSRDEPTRFSIDFLLHGVRYRYEVEFTQLHIVFEALTAYPKDKPQRWFSRRHAGKKDKNNQPVFSWRFSPNFDKSDQKLQARVRAQALFLSVAGKWNHPQLQPIHDWFINNLHHCSTENPFKGDYTWDLLERESEKARLLPYVHRADLGLTNLEAKSRELTPEEFRQQNHDIPQEIASFIASQNPTGKIKQHLIRMFHAGEGGKSYPLPFSLESQGTRQFMTLIGPVLDILEHGSVLIVDELESSLHPMLVAELVRLFMDPNTNSKGAQLLFSSHLTSLFSANIRRNVDEPLLRRDQVWFTVKSAEGESSLYPLTDYSPRKDEALERGYYAGRYGGVPFMPEGIAP